MVRCACGWPGKWPNGSDRWVNRRTANAHVRFKGQKRPGPAHQCPGPPRRIALASQYMRAVDVGNPTGKTRRLEVRSRRSDDLLGAIAWYGRWRQYTFDPAPGTTFNSSCLRDLMEFLHALMEEHRGSAVPHAGLKETTP